MKTLVLGAGKHQRIEGAIHHDIIPFEGIDVAFDLNKNWHLLANVVDERRFAFQTIIAHHLVEHLNSLIHFMNNAWNFIDRGGILEIETPNAGVNPDLEFCDPTHVRCYRPHTFTNYFTTHGIEKFGYTDKAWEIVLLETFQLEVPNDTIRVRLTPIK